MIVFGYVLYRPAAAAKDAADCNAGEAYRNLCVCQCVCVCVRERAGGEGGRMRETERKSRAKKNRKVGRRAPSDSQEGIDVGFGVWRAAS